MPAKILMSFAMANHGSQFATWLRDKLMKRYNLYAVDSVYVDSHVARSVPGQVDIAPDKRPHMLSETRAFPIGARRADWELLYANAMESAKVMIISYTTEYKASDWCMKEVAMMQRENGRRHRQGRLPLRTVILEFDSCEGQIMGLGEPTISRLKVSKTPGRGIGLAWDKHDYVLSDGDMIALTNLIGQDV